MARFLACLQGTGSSYTDNTYIASPHIMSHVNKIFKDRIDTHTVVTALPSSMHPTTMIQMDDGSWFMYIDYHISIELNHDLKGLRFLNMATGIATYISNTPHRYWIPYNVRYPRYLCLCTTDYVVPLLGSDVPGIDMRKLPSLDEIAHAMDTIFPSMIYDYNHNELVAILAIYTVRDGVRRTFSIYKDYVIISPSYYEDYQLAIPTISRVRSNIFETEHYIVRTAGYKPYLTERPFKQELIETIWKPERIRRFGWELLNDD